jgi:small-conductance mechanosensitive channel
MKDFDWHAYLSTGGISVLVAATLVVVILALAANPLTALLRRLSQPFLFSRELVRHIERPIRYALPLFGLQAVLSAAPGDLTLVGPARVVTSLAIIGVFTWLGLAAVRAAEQVVVLSIPVNVSDNLRARRIHTQTRVLVRIVGFFVLLFGISAMLMTFPTARRFGTSLLASAGIAGLAAGFAARPVLANLIAGLQIAITQPIRLDDVVIVEGEWGRIEEITGTYVVVRVWDDRRLVVPLQWFIENPFQNWTRATSSLTGAVFIWIDYALPLEPLRDELKRLCESVPQLWDGRVCVLQVTDANERAMQLRALVSAQDSSRAWDLRCHVREGLIDFVSREYPHCLPQLRAELRGGEGGKPQSEAQPSGAPERQPPV